MMPAAAKGPALEMSRSARSSTYTTGPGEGKQLRVKLTCTHATLILPMDSSNTVNV